MLREFRQTNSDYIIAQSENEVKPTERLTKEPEAINSKKGDNEGPHNAPEKLIGTSGRADEVIEEELVSQNLSGYLKRDGSLVDLGAGTGKQNRGWIEFLLQQ